MNKKLGFVVSASMMIIASQAMAHAGKDVSGVIELPSMTVDADTRALVRSALEKRDVRLAVGEVASIIVNSYGRDGDSIVNRVRVAQNVPGEQDHTFSTDDLTDPNHGYDQFVACHSACHSACHGSRGWR